MRGKSIRGRWQIALASVVIASLSGAVALGSGAAGQTIAAPASGLAYSSASKSVVQPQPRSGSCHALGSGLYSRPDPHCTPGALNPQVTQTTIRQTICRRGWTSTVRPPESVSEQEKAASMAAYGDRGPLSSYEYDHFVPLELGGATNDRRNLWPETGASPNPKDTVEDTLNTQVCEGKMTLGRAQDLIVDNWVTLAHHGTGSPPASPPPAASPPPVTAAATCTANAQFSSRYNDYDVYVHSNQPDKTVTVTAPDGTSKTWQTDGSGYADVYFYDSRSVAGQQVTARVGGATCHATL